MVKEADTDVFIPFKSGAEISVRTVSGSGTSTVSLGVGSGLSLYENLFPVVTKSTRGGASDGESAPIVYSYSGSILKSPPTGIIMVISQ